MMHSHCVVSGFCDFFQVQERFVADGNDRLKLVVLLCGEDDEKVQKAAAGTLAMLTAAQKKLCSKMTEVVRHKPNYQQRRHNLECFS